MFLAKRMLQAESVDSSVEEMKVAAMKEGLGKHAHPSKTAQELITIATNAVPADEYTTGWPAGLGWTAPDTLAGRGGKLHRLTSLWRDTCVKMCEHILIGLLLATGKKPSEINAWVHKGGAWSQVILCQADADEGATTCVQVCKTWCVRQFRRCRRLQVYPIAHAARIGS
jgi:hypothetical protein